jgi:hypothetical protein
VLGKLGIADIMQKVYPYGLYDKHSWDRATHTICVASMGTVCKLEDGLICGWAKVDSTKLVEYSTAHKISETIQNVKCQMGPRN